MIAFKAHYDGEKIVLPEDFCATLPSEVIVVFESQPESAEKTDRELWLKAQEASLAKVWENDEDAAYDSL